MKQIKIQKEFWDKIVSGEKKYEFRKLSKGLVTGTYEFVIADMNELCNCNMEYNHFKNCGIYGSPRIFGTAKLTPISINDISVRRCDKLQEYFEETNKHKCLERHPFIGNKNEEIVLIDGDSYNFVKENYIDKNIDFIAYKISEVKAHHD